MKEILRAVEIHSTADHQRIGDNLNRARRATCGLGQMTVLKGDDELIEGGEGSE